MKVFIIGAGPGDPELITVKGSRLISQCPVIIYTGSLVPEAVIQNTRVDAKIFNSASMNLDEIMNVIIQAREVNEDVARVHTGDPSLFSSVAEQLRKFRDLGIEYEIIPGVSSFSAASAALQKELTLPELSQTVIISRVEGRTSMPPGENLSELAAHGSTMVFFLSAGLLKKIKRELIPSYGADCPVAIVHRASMPDQIIIEGNLGNIEDKWRESGIKSQCIIIVGRVLSAESFADSRLYAADFKHGYRR